MIGAEAQPAHRFVASQPLPGSKARQSGLYYRLRPVEAAARADERLQRGEKGDGGRAIPFGSEHGVGHGVWPVPAFLKGEGWPDQDAVLVGVDAVQQGGHMAMVAHSIGRAAKDWDGGGGGQGQWLLPHVGQHHLHQLDQAGALPAGLYPGAQSS